MNFTGHFFMFETLKKLPLSRAFCVYITLYTFDQVLGGLYSANYQEDGSTVVVKVILVVELYVYLVLVQYRCTGSDSSTLQYYLYCTTIVKTLYAL